ncbi:hypothetical protein KR200_004827, partial [Drosophila serrata]
IIGFGIVYITTLLTLLISVRAESAEDTTIETTTDQSTTLETTEEDPITTLPPPVLCDDEEFFLPAPDCREYYQCLYGVGVLKKCPDGLYWDRELNVCGWDSPYCIEDGDKSTEAPSLSCSSGLPFLPYLPDCTKFIQCVYNIGFKLNCPGGLYWNQPLQSCDFTCDNTVEFAG